ncbi:YfhO family protein, partial [Ruminococcus sp.]|uniref:YfhO family protein n=1 Tax=Ruminococcus sp. TaxID=41978 RepID=UPI00386C6683
YTDEAYKELYGKEPEKFDSIVTSYKYDKESYKNVCDNHKANSCSEFHYTDNGFNAEFDNTDGNENLLFFSVPYSDGFTAYVNGTQTDVEKVNNGLMAVYIPANAKCSIEFIYETPGLSTGILISVISAAAFAVYILSIITFRFIKKKK